MSGEKERIGAFTGEPIETTCGRCGHDEILLDDDAFGMGIEKWGCPNPDCLRYTGEEPIDE